jgi:Ca-activated chloride channel homolog
VLTIEGFLREFQLPLHAARACAELVCVNPAVAFDPEQNRLYVQIGMNSSVTEATFRRKPLNLAIVLDVSGSMSATDETEKSRLEWAKDALEQTVRQLDASDMFSLAIFDTNSEILRRPSPVNDQAEIIAMVRRLSTRNTTNLEAGLRDGYLLASENIDRLSGYEHRVILITDAGLNTGVTDSASILRLVTDYASRGIGLTALGLGENFKQDFIHGITNSRGGNYLFVHSGKDMLRYFDAFDYLVTPIAYNFRVRLGLSDIQAKLVAAYGVPTESGMQPARPLIDLPTLFFSETGGAILLEYQIVRGE